MRGVGLTYLASLANLKFYRWSGFLASAANPRKMLSKIASEWLEVAPDIFEL